MGEFSRRAFLRDSLRAGVATILAVHSLKARLPEPIYRSIRQTASSIKDPAEFLREIYKEVRELGRYGKDNFIKREFHLNLDDNDSNREEHVVVLNHSYSGHETMLLQVTYFESRRKDSPVKYAKVIREIECYVLEGGIEIRRCDYDKTEIHTILPSILQGIRETKKYLHFIR